MDTAHMIDWLLEGDAAIQYQTHRDLLDTERKDLQRRIAHEGWGQQFLAKRNPNLHWGTTFYQPKWTSTHYTLLDLRNLDVEKNTAAIKETIGLVLASCQAEDGGLKLGPSTAVHSDICVNGMFLNYASYFNTVPQKLHTVVDCLLDERMPDGGFNCMSTRRGAVHSSLHSTLSVLEGLYEFQKTGAAYRKKEIRNALQSAEEFILMHRLFLSDHSGKIINEDFLKLTWPCRWKYDILRALDYFRYSGHRWDNRMEDAIRVLLGKRNKNGSWNMQAAHPGKVHFTMEAAGKASRWNTLRALRVLKHFKK